MSLDHVYVYIETGHWLLPRLNLKPYGVFLVSIDIESADRIPEFTAVRSEHGTKPTRGRTGTAECSPLLPGLWYKKKWTSHRITAVLACRIFKYPSLKISPTRKSIQDVRSGSKSRHHSGRARVSRPRARRGEDS
jgi:hypothetical protein